MTEPCFRTSVIVIATCLNFGLGSPAMSQTRSQTPPAETPPAVATAKETPGLKATQVTVAIEKDHKRRMFRATVLVRKDDSLTLLTAAHCMSDADKDGPALLMIEGEVVEGTVASVVRNPSYRTNQNREIAGADNAIVRLAIRKPTSKATSKAYESLKPAQAISARSYPGADGQTVSVRMIDGRGVEHALKAGNHRNPRYLEWGPSYQPIPGDSGGGVFVMKDVSDGDPQPVLIGIIVSRDEKGGAASLISQEMRWIADELAH